MVLLNVDPAMVPSDLHERPLTEAAKAIVRSGDAGLTYLVYGTREPNDMCYYPRSNKVFLRGLGVIARLENLEYGDGEPG